MVNVVEFELTVAILVEDNVATLLMTAGPLVLTVTRNVTELLTPAGIVGRVNVTVCVEGLTVQAAGAHEPKT
jgi:hypothetical protein